MEQTRFNVYPYRWVVLLAFMGIIVVNQLLWITFAPITSTAVKYYKVSELSIGLLSLIFMIVYILVSFPASWVLDTYGVRVGVGIGAALTGIFGLVRGLVASDYKLVLIAQIVIAIGQPFILTQFIGFALFMVASQAELTQPPFDMPVAESELVAGYMVEYTGFRFLFFFIGEFGTAFAFSALAATLFLGGWSVPWIHGTAADWLGPLVLFAKVMFVAFLMFWARFTYPRLREDQLQALAWKWLIPIALVNIIATGVLKVAFS